jgi:hypothetical protein
LTMLNLNFIRPRSFKELGKGAYGVVFVTKVDRELYAKKFMEFDISCEKEDKIQDYVEMLQKNRQVRKCIK